MKPSEITTYLQNLADDFELQNRHSEAIYLREAAALVVSHTSAQLTRCTMTLGDKIFDMMTELPDPTPKKMKNLAEVVAPLIGPVLSEHAVAKKLVLTFEVNEPQWGTQLHRIKQPLINTLNEHLPLPIRDIEVTLRRVR